MAAPLPLVDDPRARAHDRRRLVKAAVMLACLVLGGSVALMRIEDWTFWRSFFFTLVTITTVGYGDQGISLAGERFALVLLVLGIGLASYTFALFVQSVVSDQFAWRRRMRARIEQLKGHTIVCGNGRMGRTVCEELEAHGVPFVVLDSDPEAVSWAIERGWAAIPGQASDDEVLIEAGIERAAHVVIAFDSQQENIVAALSARELNPRAQILARAEREGEVRKLMRAGATRTVSPYHLCGVEVANAITRPKVADFLARSGRAKSDVALAEVEVEPGSALVERELREIGRCEATQVSFVTLERKGHPPMTPPRGSERLCPGDLLIVAGDPTQIAWMRDAARGTSTIPAALSGEPTPQDASLERQT